MFNKITLAFSFFIIALLHYSFLNAVPLKKQVVYAQSKPKVFKISLNKVKVTQKEIKKSKPLYEKKKLEKITKKILPKIKKIVKKAQRKVEAKTRKRITEKIVKKIIKKEQVKLVQTISKKIIVPKNQKKTITSSLKSIIKNEYLTKIKSHIEKYKKYPRRAKLLKQQGEVIVSFKIEKNGSIRDINIKSRCPFKKLNTAAINILKEIAKFDPIPNELNKSSWAIEVPISYEIFNS